MPTYFVERDQPGMHSIECERVSGGASRRADRDARPDRDARRDRPADGDAAADVEAPPNAEAALTRGRPAGRGA